jgi:hypothetical protein
MSYVTKQPQGEAAVNIGVRSERPLVIVEFDRMVTNLRMNPAEAKLLAQVLNAEAGRATAPAIVANQVRRPA